jgi:murein DD-endopeptidase MepM/ murein hydrolase activator NlpD
MAKKSMDNFDMGDEFFSLDGDFGDLDSFDFDDDGIGGTSGSSSSPSFFKNVGRSVKNFTVDIGKKYVPSLFDLKDAASSTKEAAVDRLAKVKASALERKAEFMSGAKIDVKSVAKDLYESAAKRIKSGEFYKGESGAEIDMGGWDDDFGDDDEGGYDEEPSEGRVKNAKGKVTKKKYKPMKLKFNTISAGEMMEIQNQNTIQMVKVNQGIYKRQLLVAEQHHQGQLQVLRNIASNVHMIAKFMSQEGVKNVVSAIEYRKKDLALVQDQLGLLKDIRSIQARLAGGKPKGSKPDKETKLERILGGGMFNGSAYVKNVKGNIKDMFDSSMIGQVKGMLDMQKDMNEMTGKKSKGLIGDLVGMGASFVPDMLLSSGLKNKMEKMNNIFSSAPGALLSKINSLSENSSNPVIQMMSQALGVQKDIGREMDFGLKDPRKPMPFDAQTHKTINTVIPMYLSKMTAALTKSEETYFDYSTGLMKTNKSLRDKFEMTEKETVFGSSEMVDLKSNLSSTLGKTKAGKIGNLDEELEKVITNMVRADVNFDLMDIQSNSEKIFRGVNPVVQFELLNMFAKAEKGDKSALSSISGAMAFYNSQKSIVRTNMMKQSRILSESTAAYGGDAALAQYHAADLSNVDNENRMISLRRKLKNMKENTPQWESVNRELLEAERSFYSTKSGLVQSVEEGGQSFKMDPKRQKELRKRTEEEMLRARDVKLAGTSVSEGGVVGKANALAERLFGGAAGGIANLFGGVLGVDGLSSYVNEKSGDVARQQEIRAAKEGQMKALTKGASSLLGAEGSKSAELASKIPALNKVFGFINAGKSKIDDIANSKLVQKIKSGEFIDKAESQIDKGLGKAKGFTNDMKGKADKTIEKNSFLKSVKGTLGKGFKTLKEEYGGVVDWDDLKELEKISNDYRADEAASSDEDIIETEVPKSSGLFKQSKGKVSKSSGISGDQLKKISNYMADSIRDSLSEAFAPIQNTSTFVSSIDSKMDQIIAGISNLASITSSHAATAGAIDPKTMGLMSKEQTKQMKLLQKEADKSSKFKAKLAKAKPKGGGLGNKLIGGTFEVAKEGAVGILKGGLSLTTALGKGAIGIAGTAAKAGISMIPGLAKGAFGLAKGIGKGAWNLAKFAGKGLFGLGKGALGLTGGLVKGIGKGTIGGAKMLGKGALAVGKGVIGLPGKIKNLLKKRKENLTDEEKAELTEALQEAGITENQARDQMQQQQEPKSKDRFGFLKGIGDKLKGAGGTVTGAIGGLVTAGRAKINSRKKDDKDIREGSAEDQALDKKEAAEEKSKAKEKAEARMFRNAQKDMPKNIAKILLLMQAWDKKGISTGSGGSGPGGKGGGLKDLASKGLGLASLAGLAYGGVQLVKGIKNKAAMSKTAMSSEGSTLADKVGFITGKSSGNYDAEGNELTAAQKQAQGLGLRSLMGIQQTATIAQGMTKLGSKAPGIIGKANKLINVGAGALKTKYASAATSAVKGLSAGAKNLAALVKKKSPAILKKLGKGVGGKLDGLLKTAKKLLGKIFDPKGTIGKKIGGKAAKGILAKISGKLSKTAFGKIAAKFASKIGTFAVPGIGQAILAAQIAGDFTSGMLSADRYFKLGKSTKPTFAMRATSGIVNVISGFLLGLLPTDAVVNLIWGILGKNKDSLNSAKDFITERAKVLGVEGGRLSEYETMTFMERMFGADKKSAILLGFGNKPENIAQYKEWRDKRYKPLEDLFVQVAGGFGGDKLMRKLTEDDELIKKQTSFREAFISAAKEMVSKSGLEKYAPGQSNEDATAKVSEELDDSDDVQEKGGGGDEEDGVANNMMSGPGFDSAVAKQQRVNVENDFHASGTAKASKPGFFSSLFGWGKKKPEAIGATAGSSNAIPMGVGASSAAGIATGLGTVAGASWRGGRQGGIIEGADIPRKNPDALKSIINKDFALPSDASAYLSWKFGNYDGNDKHYGIDIGDASNPNTVNYAIQDGVVVRAQQGIPDDLSDPGGRSTSGQAFMKANEKELKKKFPQDTYKYGNAVVVRHKDGTFATYAHQRQNFVKQGETIMKGAPLGYMGNTGNSQGKHLHLQISDSKGSYDPIEYLATGQRSKIFYNVGNQTKEMQKDFKGTEESQEKGGSLSAPPGLKAAQDMNDLVTEAINKLYSEQVRHNKIAETFYTNCIKAMGAMIAVSGQSGIANKLSNNMNAGSNSALFNDLASGR